MTPQASLNLLADYGHHPKPIVNAHLPKQLHVRTSSEKLLVVEDVLTPVNVSFRFFWASKLFSTIYSLLSFHVVILKAEQAASSHLAAP